MYSSVLWLWPWPFKLVRDTASLSLALKSVCSSPMLALSLNLRPLCTWHYKLVLGPENYVASSSSCVPLPASFVLGPASYFLGLPSCVLCPGNISLAL